MATENRSGSATVVSTRLPSSVPNYSTYTVRDSETFQSISTKVLGTPLLYWRIADINPQVPFPDTIPVGTVIRIPR
ncbi:LysM peptidoglycan-binding domain-containing protein [bacterium]|nr:LysM peptidoglycan-binding domain-containing protein [bacterium]